MSSEMNLIQTNVPGLYRDMNTGVILNKNTSDLNYYMIERDRLIQQEVINKKVEDLTEAVTEIKQILQLMVKNTHGNSHTS
jgi:predicted Rossmann-fold nucleotide-binding protein